MKPSYHSERSCNNVSHSRIAYDLYRCFFYFITGLIILSFVSCRSSTANSDKSSDSTYSILHQTEILEYSDQQNLRDACRVWYDSVLKNSVFNGGILVAKDGKVVFEEYKGVLKLGTNDSITKTTPLHIASVTKTFTAMAVLKLAQDGKINIDDTLTKFFPEFNYPGITVRSLLNHRSGLPNYLYFMEELGWNKSAYIQNQDILNHLIARKSEIKNIGTPNRNFNYCNTNYVLLALVIEKITGTPFPEHLRKTFFEPLNMKNTFVFTLADTSRIPPSYDWRGTEIPINFLDLAYGDKNMYTTPRDLLIWDRILSSNTLFTTATLEDAYKPYSNERPGIKNYGLGWRMNVYPTGKKMIFHNGWWHGSNAVFIRLLDEDATIIVIGNRYTNAIYKARHLVNIFDNYFADSSEEE